MIKFKKRKNILYHITSYIKNISFGSERIIIDMIKKDFLPSLFSIITEYQKEKSILSNSLCCLINIFHANGIVLEKNNI